MTAAGKLSLQRLDDLTQSVPYTHTHACHLLFETAKLFPSPQIVEVSCAYGKAAAYLAAAAAANEGMLYCVDVERPIWRGRGADDLLRDADLLDHCQMVFGEDARWYLLDLFCDRPNLWVDFAYIDASHTVEVDSFVALALWTHLRPGGVLAFDDLDWMPSVHAPGETGFSRPTSSHVKVIYDYISKLPLVEWSVTWGKEEVEWTWGFIRKVGGSPEVGDRIRQLLRS